MPIEVIIPFGAFLAALVAAAAGFGDALILGAIWFQFMDPIDAVPLIIASGLVMHAVPIVRLRKELDYSQLPVFAVAGVLGVPLGVWLLAHTAPEPFRLGVGWLLVMYVGFIFLMPRNMKIEGGGKAADGAVGFAGGVLGGFAGLSGVTPILWTGLRGWPKARQRGVYQPFVFIMHCITLAGLTWHGMVGMQTLERFLWCLPAIGLGTWLGLIIYRKLNEVRFRQFILGLVFVSGIALIL